MSHDHPTTKIPTDYSHDSNTTSTSQFIKKIEYLVHDLTHWLLVEYEIQLEDQ